jgi:hypothetical protein
VIVTRSVANMAAKLLTFFLSKFYSFSVISFEFSVTSFYQALMFSHWPDRYKIYSNIRSFVTAKSTLTCHFYLMKFYRSYGGGLKVYNVSDVKYFYKTFIFFHIPAWALKSCFLFCFFQKTIASWWWLLRGYAFHICRLVGGLRSFIFLLMDREDFSRRSEDSTAVAWLEANTTIR